MARLWSSGFELNSLTAGVEFSVIDTGGTIDTTTVRSGTYSYKVNTTTTSNVEYDFKASDNLGPFYIRFYFRIAANFTSTSGTNFILTLLSSGNAIRCGIVINADRTLQLWNATAQVGSNSTALNTNQWYRIELFFDGTGSGSTDQLDARIDGISFASSSTQFLFGPTSAVFGLYNFGVTGTPEWYFDDLAINDTTGSFQTSWPGAGEIKHLMPNAAGDNAQWTRGGTDSGANWSQVEEIPPNDATDFVNNISVVNNIDDYNLGASGLTGSDSITLVQVGFRIRQNEVADTDSLRIKASSGGTVEASAGINQVDTSWHTNAAAAPFNYSLTLYDLPGASTTAWTSSDLDVAQIGISHDGGTTTGTDVSTEWLLVEFVTGGATSTSTTTTTSSSTSTSTTSTSSSTSTTRSTSTSTSTTKSTSSTSSSTSTSTSTTTTSSSTTTSTTSSTSTTTTQSITTSTSSTSSSTSTTASTSTSVTTTTSTSTSISTSTTSTIDLYISVALA